MNQDWATRRVLVIGFRRWKAYSLYPILKQLFREVVYLPDVAAIRRYGWQEGDCLAVWSSGDKVAGLKDFAAEARLPLLRIEDGFIRSVGLGSDLISPVSLVLDEAGIYFDPTHPSGLEMLLSQHSFSADELMRAERAADFIVRHHLTKYNIDSLTPPAWQAQAQGKKVILVPGQVEDDASIRLGCGDIRTNLQLLQAARQAEPQAWIVYKPHPDVLARNRVGALGDARQYADVVETDCSVVSLLEICHGVHTMTSLTGFDALLRNREVTVYGQPFYAGWGLTQDQGLAFSEQRRQRSLTLNELVAGTLLLYPLYFDWSACQLSTCEAALEAICRERDQAAQEGRIHRLKQGWWRRQSRKVKVLANAFGTKWYG